MYAGYRRGSSNGDVRLDPGRSADMSRKIKMDGVLRNQRMRNGCCPPPVDAARYLQRLGKRRSKKRRFSTGQQSFLINKRAKEATRWGVLGRERACAIHRYDCSGVFVWREARIRAPGLGIGVGCANQTARVALTFSFNQGSPERLSKATS